MATPSPIPPKRVFTMTRQLTRPRGLSRQLSKALTISAFTLPVALIYFGFVLWPMLQAAVFSTYRWNGLGPLENFTGFSNITRIISDGIFVKALGHNALVIALSICVQLPISLGLALLMNERMRGRAIFRTIFFLPFVLSEVITGLVWGFIYFPNGGLVNTLSSWLFGAKPVAWLAEPGLVLGAVFVVVTWKYFGYHMVLFLAGLQNIPQEINEAARVDGATGAQALRFITIPLLGPTIRLTIYLSVLGSLQIFDLVWVMTNGGPVNASETMATYLYRFGFQRFQLGYGSAVAVLMFILCFSFSLIYQRFVMRRDFA
jgi:raffinose/stachyose/melibiose transport system permease protein